MIEVLSPSAGEVIEVLSPSTGEVTEVPVLPDAGDVVQLLGHHLPV